LLPHSPAFPEPRPYVLRIVRICWSALRSVSIYVLSKPNVSDLRHSVIVESRVSATSAEGPSERSFRVSLYISHAS
jgi:hypothetical protein